MLLPAQIKSHQFTMSRGTYKSTEVDSFINEVASSYEQIFRENGELIKKLEILADKIEEYRRDEDNIRLALLTAQRAAETITTEASESAQKIKNEISLQAQTVLTEAKAKAEKILSDAFAVAQKQLNEAQQQSKDLLSQAQKDIVNEENTLTRMKKEASDFRAQLMAIYKTHVELINDIPHIVEEENQTIKPQANIQQSAPEVTEEIPVQLSIEEEKYEEPEKFIDEEIAYEEEEGISASVQEEEESINISPMEKYARIQVSEISDEEVHDFEEIEETPYFKSQSDYQSSAVKGDFDELDNIDREFSAARNTSDFEELKFGDDYDIFDDDEDDSTVSKGFFRKK